MTRLLTAAVILALAAAPAFACEWQKSVSTDSKASTVASQPSDDQAVPPPSTGTDHTPS
jgi:hypothetical protein